MFCYKDICCSKNIYNNVVVVVCLFRSASGVGSPSAIEVSHRARSATVSSTSSPARSRSGRSESPFMKATLCRSQGNHH